MAQFIKKRDLKSHWKSFSSLKYKHFPDFLHQDRLTGDWKGISLQHPTLKYTSNAADWVIEEALADYKNLLVDIITRQAADTTGNGWTVRHGKMNYPWLPDKGIGDARFALIFELFDSLNLDYHAEGALLLETEELMELTPCLLQYPAFLRHRDLFF